MEIRRKRTEKSNRNTRSLTATLFKSQLQRCNARFLFGFEDIKVFSMTSYALRKPVRKSYAAPL